MKDFIIEVIILLFFVLLFKWFSAPDYIALGLAIIIINLWQIRESIKTN